MSNLVDITSDNQFSSLISKKDAVIVLDFWAPWAEPCKQMNDVIAELAGKFSSLQFLKIEAENFADISEEYEIAAVPTVIVLKGGKIVERVEGAKAAEVTNVVAKHAKGVSGTKATGDADVKPAKDLNSRLKELIESANVMVFIKGTPSQPRCGFTRQLIDILAEQQVKYSSFNILMDEEVRQGLKAYSNWPTYPQMYVKGELIGGLDIVKELVASGELKETIEEAS
ncbi:Grx4 family monothiol glutaredoxin [Lichtheimia ornata]|uniref:Grx4 family monothiol glutaredoxin n=1 Tax=Lichtheimia ornata TaxID=688661 RepID=A0AAD7UUK0_9FUNG|nr:Grx4 family monothiol glutaredoxin [Lichtheimia ornata]KAJ8652541.1 Grx4 family monothiol glutaredoxin [Lichtheimia ornata]